MKCLDTYALIEITQGNLKYRKITEEDFLITDLTLSEFYSHLYKKHDLKTAEYWLRKFIYFTKPVPLGTLLKAVRFRTDNKKQNLSFFDCVGYVFARENNLTFVTGDQEFKDRDGVEFIK